MEKSVPVGADWTELMRALTEVAFENCSLWMICHWGWLGDPARPLRTMSRRRSTMGQGVAGAPR
ncbi:MAG: hypothetical protein ACSHYF_03595 [Verrucomicrobiaceae bacterium]